MRGKIFDIQRCSLHDGPGIRTTVFLKGCPLRCLWCSSPESFSIGTGLSHMAERCTSCLDCTRVCESGALHPGENGLEVDREKCQACGKCVEECPEDALKLYGYEATPEEIIAEVMKDRDYYEHSGGGLTLSGGEVLMQAVFACELLKLAKQEGIHTCIETSGFGKKEDLEILLPHVDLFLFDYKATGSSLHQQLTGVDPELILSNLDFLATSGARIHLRCPVIPGLNDRESHFPAIKALRSRYAAIEKAEILPYHNFGEHKYAQLGMKEKRETFPLPSPEQIRYWNSLI